MYILDSSYLCKTLSLYVSWINYDQSFVCVDIKAAPADPRKLDLSKIYCYT